MSCYKKTCEKLRGILEWYEVLIDFLCKHLMGCRLQTGMLLLYKSLMDIIYYCYIGSWADFGIRVSALNILSSYLFILIYSIFWNEEIKKDRPSSILVSILALLYFIPLTTWCSLGLGSTGLLISGLFYWLVLSVLQNGIPIVYIKGIGKKENSRRLYYILLIFISGLTIYISARYTNFRILLSLEDVYSVRAEATNYNMPRILSYFRSVSTVMIPIFILMSVYLKKYVGVLWGMFLLFLNFSFGGSKTTLFMGIFLIIGAFFWRSQMKYLILPGAVCIGFLTIVERVVLDSHYLMSYFFRRVCIVPVRLSDRYFRFFKNNPRDVFRSTLLGKVGFESPYSQSLPHVVGNNYDNQLVSANNGLLADVWAHIGPIGLIVMPIILIVLFRMFDMVSRNIDIKYLLGLCIYYAVTFTNCSWSTILITHGFFVMCLLLCFFPRKLENVTEREKNR